MALDPALVDRSLDSLATAETCDRGGLEAERADLAARISNLTTAIVMGGDIPALVDSPRQAETRLRAVERDLAPRDEPDRAALQAAMTTKVEGWKAIVVAHGPQTKETLREVVAAAVVHQWEAAAARGALPRSPTSTSDPRPTIAPTRATNESPLPTAVDQHRPADSVRPSVPHIREAVERFLRATDKRQLSWETTRKYRGLLQGRLLSWCEREQLTILSALSVTRMDDFRETWTDGPGYAAKNVERLRAFFQFCVDRDWIARNPAKALKTHQTRLTPTLPYTDQEVARLIAACDRYRGNQDRMRAFVLTIRYSGLRISDMIALHPCQRIDDRLRLYTTKTGEPVYVPLPPFVVAALIQIERPDERYFTTGKAKLATDRANWSANLSNLFDLAEVENGRSHRFRDTFSTSLLERGTSDETVAMLLGTTPAVVRKHYAPWIKSRQVALEVAVRATWEAPLGGSGEPYDV